MKARLSVIIVGLSVAGIFGGLYAANVIQNTESQKFQEEWREFRAIALNTLGNQKTCEDMGGTWNDDHCLISSETFDSNNLTCDPGPVLESGTCQSNGIKLVFESTVTESEPSDGIFYPRYHVSIYPNTKTMEQYATPDFITIGPNSQVTWSNYDDTNVSLNSVDPDNAWSTSVIPPDGYDTVTFEETGIYEYKGNAGIHGFVVVMDDDGQLLESKFSNVFGHTSPIVYNEGMKPVLLYDNCKRYVYWLNEHGHEDIHVPEDYPRYPPWGNQIFPLVEFCTNNGELVKTVTDNSIRWEFIVNSNSLRPEDRLQVSNTAGYTTVYVTLSSWDEYDHWESKRGEEHDKMPPLVITQDNINPIVFDLLQEMWKFEYYKVSNHDPHLFQKKIQKDYSVPNHHGVHDWMESEYAKQFGKSNDGFSHYFEYDDKVYTVIMLAAD